MQFFILKRTRKPRSENSWANLKILRCHYPVLNTHRNVGDWIRAIGHYFRKGASCVPTACPFAMSLALFADVDFDGFSVFSCPGLSWLVQPCPIVLFHAAFLLRFWSQAWSCFFFFVFASGKRGERGKSEGQLFWGQLSKREEKKTQKHI